ncbi:sensor histidine kinase [Bordetella sp. FB-8]|uniref:sensor histidine kinase n=1 Tax=Bordetella sp. FB-8 TaxID=1159870 RepID=UPI00037EF62C|nr:sensor histidine kinase [Bordetella sp. FB-8]
MKRLRLRLVLWVLIPMAVALGLTTALSWRDARENALLLQDRRLLASAEMMAEQVRWIDQALIADTPPAALRMLASSQHDLVYFQVRALPDDLLAGWPDLSSMPVSADGKPNYGNVAYRGEMLRMVTISRRLYRNGQTTIVLVSVAQGLKSFSRFVANLWQPVLFQESALLTLTLVLMLVGLTFELKPLLKLRKDLETREADDLTALDTTQLHQELWPMVDTINQYVARLTRQHDIQKRFIADAAHQLRTPIALMSTQLDYAGHLQSADELREMLVAVRANARRLKDLVNQLLSLSQAEASREAKLPREPVSLLDLAHRVLVGLSVLADDKGVDLGLDAASVDTTVMTCSALLHELLFNLVDNAVRYTPRGGHVTVYAGRADALAILRVDDTGPGIPVALRSRVFERFSRGNLSDSGGFGLGLAIVSEAAKVCRADVELADGLQGKGLCVIVRLPLATDGSPETS